MAKSIHASHRHQSGLPALTRDQFWSEHINNWRQSGLSQSAYCRDEGWVLHQWHSWRKKLGMALPSTAVVDDFLPVHVLSSHTSEPLSLTLPTGVVITGITRDNVDVVSGLMARL